MATYGTHTDCTVVAGAGGSPVQRATRRILPGVDCCGLCPSVSSVHLAPVCVTCDLSCLLFRLSRRECFNLVIDQSSDPCTVTAARAPWSVVPPCPGPFSYLHGRGSNV
eukprot:875945-Prymnesium_polylepis.2